MQEQEYILKNAKSFEPKHVFECGQCFRWNRENDGSYTGMVGHNVLNVSKYQDNIKIKGYCEDNIKDVCNKYFDLETNYEEVKEELSKKDKYLKESIKFGEGIRILKQDVWETLISFIISANNNIPRIKGIIERISEKYGEEMEWNEKKYYTFPTVEELSRATIEDLRKLGLGFRDKRVYDTTQMVRNNEIHILRLETESDTKYILNELLKFPGVGPKVADCIMLFSMKKYQVFPVDVWVKRVMLELYSKEIYDVMNNERRQVAPHDILKFAEDKFGNMAGLAQQYLFYWRREQ